MSSFLSSLCILEISPLSGVGMVKIFPHSADHCFVLLTVSFTLHKLFSFMKSYLLILGFSVSYISVLQETSKVFLSQSVQGYSPFFSVSGFMLRSLIHLDLSFVQDDI